MTIDWQTPLANLQAAISGVYAIAVTDGGTGYTLPPLLTIDAPPVGGVQATAKAVMGISSVQVTNGGQGYTSAPIVGLTPTLGGAGAYAVLNPFAVDHINVTSGGSGYTQPPAVSIVGGGGSGATGVAVLSGGQVVKVSLVGPNGGGSGYTTPPTITFVGGGGIGATATAIIESTGAICGISTSGLHSGSGYENPIAANVGYPGPPPSSWIPATLEVVTNFGLNLADTSTFSFGSADPGTDSSSCAGYTWGASYVCVVSAPDISPQEVTNVQAVLTIDLPAYGAWPIDEWTNGITVNVGSSTAGSGYSRAPTIHMPPPDDPSNPYAGSLQITPGITGGLGAIGVANGGQNYRYTSPLPVSFTSPDVGTDIATAIALVAAGAVTNVIIQNGGEGYAQQPTVVITAPSSGIAATAVAYTSPSVVSQVNLTTPGAGYSTAPVVNLSGGGGLGATASAVLKPTTVGSVVVDYPGTGYASPPAVTFRNGAGIDATAVATLKVVSTSGLPSGYEYLTVPNVTSAPANSDGGGATFTASLTPAIQNKEVFSLSEAVQIVNELTSIGEQYEAGQPLPVTSLTQSVYVAQPSFNWLEFDRATRFAATKMPSFSWPATWAMAPSSDPAVIMTQRAPKIVPNLDPFFAEVWTPLHAKAVLAYDYYLTQQREQYPSTIPYDDSSALSAHLLALIATANEMTAYLETL